MSVFGARLKIARLRAKMSQEKLGQLAGLDEMSASTRINRYELGKRSPNFVVVEQLASVLNVPTAYFYTQTEDEAELLYKFHQLSKKKKVEALALLDAL